MCVVVVRRTENDLLCPIGRESRDVPRWASVKETVELGVQYVTWIYQDLDGMCDKDSGDVRKGVVVDERLRCFEKFIEEEVNL